MQKNSFTNRRFVSLFLLAIGMICIIVTNFLPVGTAQHLLLSSLIVLLGIASYVVVGFGAKHSDK